MQYQTSGLGVASLVATRFSSALIRVQGYFSGATADRWLQIHDAAKLPANTAVPLRVYPLPQQAPFHWGFDPSTIMCSNGIVVAFSTTEATLTISADTGDIMVDGDSEQHVASSSHIGSATTADEILDVVTSLATVYRILASKVTAATEAWIQVFDVNEADLVSGTTKPVAQLYHPAAGNNSTYEFNFGSNGRSFAKCCVALSSTGNVYTALAANEAYLQGIYK